MLEISKPKNISEFISKFVIKTLPKIIRELEYESLNEIIQALYDNANTLPTTLTGRKHGPIGLIIKEIMYATLETGTLWEDPDDPGSIPAISTNRNYWVWSLVEQRIIIPTYFSSSICDNNSSYNLCRYGTKRVDNTIIFFIIVRNTTYYYTSLWSHQTTLYVQTSEIISIPQLSYDNVSIKFVIAIHYFLMPRTVTFLSSNWHTHLRTTIQISIYPLTRPTLSLFTCCSPQPPLRLISCS